MQDYAKLDNSEITAVLFSDPAELLPDCPEYAEDVKLLLSDTTALTARLYCSGKDDPTILYFHGSPTSVNRFETTAKSFVRHGMNLLLISCADLRSERGGSEISSMMDSLPLIFKKTLLYLREKQFTGALFTMGESLGSACIIEITKMFPDELKGMIIVSGFCDTVPFLTGSGVQTENLELTENDGFNNKTKISDITLPTLILHGARDTVVPPPQAESLQASSGARNKQFFIIPGAEHTTVAETGGSLYFQTIKTFADTVSGVNTWRQRRRNSRKKKE